MQAKLNLRHELNDRATMIFGDALDCLRLIEDSSVDLCVTSPPYWKQRDYGGIAGQLGRERKPLEYVNNLSQILNQVARVLKPTGSLWLNLGDTRYGGELVGIPWWVAFSLMADKWRLLSNVIWNKPNAMPQSVSTRPTDSHEHLFLFAVGRNHYYNADAIREPLSAATVARDKYSRAVKAGKHADGAHQNAMGGYKHDPKSNPKGRNKRSVWNVSLRNYKGAHFATYPPELIEPCILASCPEGGLVLDPFTGSGTTGQVALSHGRRFIGCELNAGYLPLIEERLGVSCEA